jgi:hypothetical protein
MSTAATWALVGAIAALVLGLLLFGRGTEHHRGDEVGTARSPSESMVLTTAGGHVRHL